MNVNNMSGFTMKKSLIVNNNDVINEISLNPISNDNKVKIDNNDNKSKDISNEILNNFKLKIKDDIKENFELENINEYVPNDIITLIKFHDKKFITNKKPMNELTTMFDEKNPATNINNFYEISHVSENININP